MKKFIAIIVLGLLWCSTSFAGLDTLAELDKELIRLGSNSVEHNLECTVPPKAAKKDWSTIIYKVGTSTMNNKLFAHKWWPPFEKYEVVSSRAIVTPMDNDVAKSQTMWFFLGISAKAKEAGKRQSIRKHLMLEFVDGSDEYMLYVSEVEISKEDIIILKKFNKERIENAPDTASFDISKFTSMTTKLTRMYMDTFVKYSEISEGNVKKFPPLVCRTK